MKIDRKIQREILELLANHQPHPLRKLWAHLNQFEEDAVIANALYLEEHGLINSGYELSKSIGIQKWHEPRAHRITAKGLDFLMDDGGLGAILGVVTVKLDASSIKALVMNQIDQAADITHEERSRLKTLVRTAGDQSLRKLVDSLIERGFQAVSNSPQLIGMLQGLLA